MSFPQRRASDATRRARLLAWWSRYWELIVGVWLILLTGGLFVIGARSYETNQQLLQRERICADTNQGDPCRALVDRLDASITREQQFRRACAVLGVLDNPTIVRVVEEECP